MNGQNNTKSNENRLKLTKFDRQNGQTLKTKMNDERIKIVKNQPDVSDTSMRICKWKQFGQNCILKYVTEHETRKR